MNIMIIDPHPDDAELSIGGSMISHVRKGHDLFLLDLTNGEPTPRGSVQIRLAEARTADKILKIKKRVTLNFPNRYLQDKIEYREQTAEYIRKFRPDILLVPNHLDAHPDHISASAIGAAARFYAKFTKSRIKGEPFYPPKIFFYFCSHMRININPSFILPVSKDLFAKKLSAVKAYKSQFSYGENKKIPAYVETMNSYFGSLINADFGEPFYTPESLGIKELGSLV